MANKFKFTHMETGKTYAFATEEQRDAFIEGGCNEEDDLPLNADVIDAPVIKEEMTRMEVRQLGAPLSMSNTIDAMMKSMAEITKIAIDQQVGFTIIRHLLDAQESMEEAYLYLTDRSYKGRAE
jgi:hypothetical protein